MTDKMFYFLVNEFNSIFVLQEHGSALVMFYAPCKSTAFFFVFTNSSFCRFLFSEIQCCITVIWIIAGCGHCKRMKPAYASAATKLKNLEVRELNQVKYET
jgi:hypothetical protein